MLLEFKEENIDDYIVVEDIWFCCYLYMLVLWYFGLLYGDVGVYIFLLIVLDKGNFEYMILFELEILFWELGIEFELSYEYLYIVIL